MATAAASEPQPDAAPPPAAEVVLLRAGGRRLALPVECMREVVPARPYTPLPGSADWVLGLANVRGRILTVLDLGGRLGLARSARLPQHRILILEQHRRWVGLAVDDIARLLRIDVGALARTPEALRSTGLDAPAARAVGHADGEDFVLLDPDELLRPAFA